MSLFVPGKGVSAMALTFSAWGLSSHDRVHTRDILPCDMLLWIFKNLCEALPSLKSVGWCVGVLDGPPMKH